MAIKIGILGAGKVGIAIAALLDITRFVDSVVLADIRLVENLDELRKVRFRKLDVHSEPDLANFVSDCDAIVSATPYYLNKTIAQTCARFGKSYFDLTEDVDTANFIRGLAAESRSTFMPQCGLAPGAINIIASGLARSFNVVRSVEMRVGALPLSASNQMKYYLSWSTAGLINEYCHCGEALYQGRRLTNIAIGRRGAPDD